MHERESKQLEKVRRTTMQIKDSTSLIEPFGIDIDVEAGIMHNPQNHVVRRASDLRGYYADEQALERLIEQEDPIMYEVFEIPVPHEYGHLMFCISQLHPGLVGDEYFMTKGHYHTVLETGETYLGLRGEGYIMLKTQDGQVRAEPIKRGKMVYCPPYWAHRSVNTSDDDLISYCVYPGEAGHNYGDIEKEGFLKRVYKKHGKPVIGEY
jgi:glucose-6-phosphate isomerase